jgi:DNA-directed RNA polymerase subunit RPC12/RpoP
MEPRWIKPFVYSAGGILLAAALIRFVIAAGNAPVMALPEPTLGIPLRYAVLVIGAIEAAVALYSLFGSQTALQVAWLGWLTANFVFFRFLLLLVRSHPQATCIGSLTDPLHLSRGMPGLIMTGALLYFLLGSCVASVNLLWLEDQIPQPAETRKMTCPGCGIHIRFALQNLGQRIPCPHCQRIITLREPDLLKTVCLYCKQHIEFPAHAIGQKIRCPHCKNEIPLKEPS